MTSQIDTTYEDIMREITKLKLDNKQIKEENGILKDTIDKLVKDSQYNAS